MIITPMQIADGQSHQPVTDRSRRFDYTRRYREANPGGMAHALAGMAVDPEVHPGLLLFDGLRGVNEVRIRHRGIAAGPLHRPECAGRCARATAAGAQRCLRSGWSGIERRGIERRSPDQLSPIWAWRKQARSSITADEAQLLALVNSGQVSADDLAAKLRIVVEERRNYDPWRPAPLVMDLAPFRSVVVDTTEHSPEGAATLISRKLEI